METYTTRQIVFDGVILRFDSQISTENQVVSPPPPPPPPPITITTARDWHQHEVCLFGKDMVRTETVSHNRIPDLSNFKAFADNKLNDSNFEICFGWDRKYVGSGEKARYQHFLLFHQ